MSRAFEEAWNPVKLFILTMKYRNWNTGRIPEQVSGIRAESQGPGIL
jgi:hypothetical protein